MEREMGQREWLKKVSAGLLSLVLRTALNQNAAGRRKEIAIMETAHKSSQPAN